jgi:hypothetical protein
LKKDEDRKKKEKLTTEELNRLLLNIDPAEFEKPNFGADYETGSDLEEPEVNDSTEFKQEYNQKIESF